MAVSQKPIVSIILFLRQPVTLEHHEVERAAECAFEVLFNSKTHRVLQMPGKPMFAVAMPEMTLGVISADRPYFNDIGHAADRIRDVATKQAVQEHTAWISVDLMGDPAQQNVAGAYVRIAKLVAELIQPGTLALAMTPAGKISAYDACFLPLLRRGLADEVFKLGPPSKIVKSHAEDAELAAAAAEARRRWPEFLAAFAQRKPAQGFAVKKKFVEGEGVEHMWVEVTAVSGATLRGRLANEPGTVRGVKLGDSVTLDASEIEDWLYSDGARMVGGFQAKILKNRKP